MSRKLLPIMLGVLLLMAHQVMANDLPTSGSWHQLDTPIARSGHAAIYDPIRNRMLVIGGLSGYAATETWALALGEPQQWTAVETLDPPALRGATAVYDSVSDAVKAITPSALFTLSLSGAPQWTSAPVSGFPFPRYGHSLSFDSEHQRWVLVGGYANDQYLDDVWVLPINEPLVWRQVPVAGTSLPPRLQHTCTYDPLRDRMIVFGGDSDHGFLSDTWALEIGDSARWTAIPASASAPINRYDHVTIYDPLSDRLIAYGGGNQGYTLCSLDLAHPTEWVGTATNSDGEVHQFSLIIDPVGERLIRYGGTDTDCELRDLWIAPLADITNWIHPFDGTFGPDFVVMGITFDSRHRRIAIHGGRSSCHNEEVGDVLSFLELQPAPHWSGGANLSREKHVIVYDSNRDRLLLFGGDDANGDFHQEVMSFDPAAPASWQQLPATGIPPGEYSVAPTAAYDAMRDRMWIFRSGAAMWFYDVAHGVWNSVSSTGASPAFGAIVIDPRTGDVLVRDYSTGGIWRFHEPDTTWELLATSGTAPINGYTVIDSLTHAIYVVSDQVSMISLDDRVWTTLHTTGHFPAWSTAVVFDHAGRRLVVYGGHDACNEFVGDCDYHGIWELRLEETTDVLISRASARWERESVRARWDTSLERGRSVDVLRSSDRSPWTVIGRVAIGTGGAVEYLDHDADPSVRQGYALELDAGVGKRIGEVWCESRPVNGLYLGRPTPNPSSRAAVVTFTVPTSRPVSIELIDLMGRRVYQRRVEVERSGPQTLLVDPRIPPGVYRLRVEQDGSTASGTMVRIR